MSFKSLKQKLITAFICFAIVPLVTVGTLAYQRSHASLEARAGEKLFLQAQAAIDAIDRNLFERYGDVQAFAANPDARGSREEAVAVANFFTENYGIYDLMIIADMDRSIVTANTVDHAGKPLDTSGLIGRSVKGEEWFEQCASGRIPPAHSSEMLNSVSQQLANNADETSAQAGVVAARQRTGQLQRWVRYR